MNITESILWQWSMVGIRMPPNDVQELYQSMALGVIKSHQQGNVTPLDDSQREYERINSGNFSSLIDETEHGIFEHQQIKDCFFSSLDESQGFLIEIFYCWNSIKHGGNEQETFNEDLPKTYLVKISELLMASEDVVTSFEEE
jgi:hypothetical protein